MNEANYVTLPVAQRLVAAGIVLETEVYRVRILTIVPNMLSFLKRKQRGNIQQYE
jgi:hypothetical protein